MWAGTLNLPGKEKATPYVENRHQERKRRVALDIGITKYSIISRLLMTVPVTVRKKVLFLEKRRKAVKA